MIRSLTYYDWRHDMSGRCGDPRHIAESFGNYADFVGLESALLLGMSLYLVPLLLIGGFATFVYVRRHRQVLLSSPDLLLLILPGAIWIVLAVIMPIGKPTLHVFELSVIGALGGVTVLLRGRYSNVVQLELSKAGLLGMVSFAICVWAFIPPW